MPFYPNYLTTNYYFGKEEYEVQFPNLVAYSDIWEEISKADDNAFYLKYYIKEGLRPDNVAYELYNDATYSWTLFYVNPLLRERGWPLGISELFEKVQRDFPNTVVTTRDDLFGNFRVGTIANGQTTNEYGTIIERNLNLGQLVFDGTVAFEDGESLVITEDDTTKTLTIESVVPEHLAIHHYSNSTGVVDIDPNIGPDEDLTAVTVQEDYQSKNEELRTIRVLKPDVIEQVMKEFKRIMA